MMCPHCALPLASRGPGARCPRCDGAWVPARELPRELGGAVFAAGTHATAACPACGIAMAPVTLAGVELDRCADHGMWFDAGELAQLRDRDQGGRNILNILVGFVDSWS